MSFMHKLPMLAAVLCATAASTLAQTCATPPAARVFSNRDEFVGSFYYNIGNHFADIATQRDISISQIATWTYDQGVGNPPVPNQVGATGVVNVYTCPNSRTGNEAISPTAPGTPWTLLGSGTILVVATPGDSPITFNPPLFLPAGTYGLAIEYLATTNGPNPGPLHCLGLSPNPGAPVSDQFLTWSNDGIQGVSWTGVATASPNLRVTYTPEASSGHWTNAGVGCYFRPYAFYENFPASATPPDVANTSLAWIFTGNNYIVVPGGNSFVPSTSTSLTSFAYGSSSSANWDDALTTPITLPWPMNYPGGSTSIITISSNGCVYLASVIDNSYEVCGSSYGSIAPFRDEAPRIGAYFMDLDPDPITGSGTMHYDVDPAQTFVRITWAAVREWQLPTVPTAINTMQLTIYQNGNIDVVYGALANTSVANGNNAIVGFTPGLGSTLPPPIDISASLPYTCGDGQIPPILALVTRPVIGTTFNMIVSNIDPTTVIQLMSLGTALNPPIDLGIIGMPGCSLHHNALVLLTNVVAGGVFTQPFTIPNNPTFLNAQLTAQGFPFTPGFNPFGFVASNAVCMRVGF
jgi:hypothetical protein